MTYYKFHCEKCNFFTNYSKNYKRHLDTGAHNNVKRKDYSGHINVLIVIMKHQNH
jgi:hypothetical protein